MTKYPRWANTPKITTKNYEHLDRFEPTSSRRIMGGRGRNSLIYTGPEGKPGGESRFPLSLQTDGVLNTKLSIKKKKKP